MTTQPVEPTPVDLASFSDNQLAAMLNMGGRARWIAIEELARRHPLTEAQVPGAAPSAPHTPGHEGAPMTSSG